MKEPIERELKILIKEEDMNFIIKSYDLNKYKIQTNIYYDTLDRYLRDVTYLLVFVVICLTISFISLRREKYDSI